MIAKEKGILIKSVFWILWKHDWQIEMQTDQQMDRQTDSPTMNEWINEWINEWTNEWMYKTWLQGREEYWLRVFSEIFWKHDWQIEM